MIFISTKTHHHWGCTTMNMFQKLCCQFVERANYLGLKGKSREVECLAFMVGAATVLQNTDHPEAGHVLGCVSMILTVRGYSEVVRVAMEAQAQAA
jgi:hypothetical protein